MKTREKDKVEEIVFYTKKLPFPKQEEALDCVKWLWVNVDKKKNGSIKPIISKIREIQSLHKSCKGWDSVEIIRELRGNR